MDYSGGRFAPTELAGVLEMERLLLTFRAAGAPSMNMKDAF